VKDMLRPLPWTVLAIACVLGLQATAQTDSGSRGACSVKGAQLWAHTELYFGTSIQPAGTLISEQQYQQFVDAQVTPRFPEGFTVFTGSGQFRNASGVIVREPTKVLVLSYPSARATSDAIEAIRTAYVSKFQQEAVMRVDEAPVCVGF
jgi:uncharacterized protein DUF3574